MVIRIFAFAILLFFARVAFAQEILQTRPSPLAIISLRYKNNYVKITYSQPQKKGREIFGHLIPFGQVWRTGANEATEITTTQDIQIDSIVLKAGTYSLFTIPEKDQWTVIINTDVGLWGAYNYDATHDLWRFKVPVHPTHKLYEPFTMIFDQHNEVANLLMMWDRTQVSIPLKFIN
jgi:hypothetical protein